MKTEIINQEVQTGWDFPCLGKSKYTELVVFFTSNKTGIVLIPDIICPIGEYSDSWAMDLFKPLKGETTIKFKK